MQFFHVRKYTSEGKLLAGGGYTFAMIETNNLNEFRWGVCKCNEKDIFCKKIGRTKSAGRAVSNTRAFATPILNEESQLLFVQNLSAYMYISKKSYPTGDNIKAALMDAFEKRLASPQFIIKKKKSK